MPRDENRAVGVPLDPGTLAFTVADCYETKVAAPGSTAPGRDTSRAPGRLRSDSL